MSTDRPLYDVALSDRAYWGALLVFGLVVLGQGAVDVVTASSAVSTYLTVFAGLLVAGSAAVGLRGDYTLQNDPRSVATRLLAVGGVVVYVTLTAVETLG
jgi:hypothetical protein